MRRETFTPADEAAWHALRAQDLTSTDSAALFRLSPYQTPFELWHRKKAAEITAIDQNDRMLWGNRLQDAIAAGIAEDLGLIIRPMREYIRLPEHRLGSSFDFAIDSVLPNSRFADIFHELGPGILEIKNVDWLAFRNGWLVEADYLEAPAHIEIQTQHQQLCSGRRWSIIGALVGGNRYEVLERLADPQVHAGIIAKAADFWESIDADQAPPPVMPDDAAAVIALYQYAAPGKLLDARTDEDLAAQLMRHYDLGQQIKRLTEDRDVLKAELLQRIGDAEKVITAAGNISAGIVGPAEISYTRDPYRNFRFTPSKAAKAAAQENAA